MHNYNYQQQLKQIWTDAVTRYQGGQRVAEGFFNPETLAELAQIGLNKMDVFDYAEDFVALEEPDFETFLLVHSVRRDYFSKYKKGLLQSIQSTQPSYPLSKTQFAELNGCHELFPRQSLNFEENYHLKQCMDAVAIGVFLKLTTFTLRNF